MPSTLIGATYRRMTSSPAEAPSFVGWHRHDLGTAGNIDSIAVGPTANGTLDRLTMITDGVLNDTMVFFNEEITQIFDEDDTLYDAWFMDRALVPDSVYEDIVNGVDGARFTGLRYLIGNTVCVWACGLDLGDYVVDALGSIFVPFGSGVAPATFNYQAAGAGHYLFTQAMIAALVAKTLTFRNGGTEYSKIGTMQPSLFAGQSSGNFGILNRIVESTLNLGYTYGTSNSGGPPGAPSIAYPQNMAQTNGVLYTGSSTRSFTLNRLLDGKFIAGNGYVGVVAAAAWILAGTNVGVDAGSNNTFYVVDNIGHISAINTVGPTFTDLGAVNTLIDPQWPGVATFSGCLVDQTDNGVLTFAQVNGTGWNNYNAGTTYAVGDQVNSGPGVTYYRSLVAGNIGNTPATSPTDWALIQQVYLCKFTTGPTPTLAWKIAIGAMPTMLDTMGQGQILQGPVVNQQYAYLQCKNSNPLQLVTVNTATGSFTSAPVPGVYSPDAGNQTWDNQSKSIIFYGDYTSTTTGAPIALHSTVTCTKTWMRYYPLTNSIQSFVPSIDANGISPTNAVVDWGNNVVLFPMASLVGVRTYNATTGAQGNCATMDWIVSGSGTTWYNAVGVCAAIPLSYTQVGLIPAVVGASFTSQGQLLRPVAPEVTGVQTGPAMGHYRRSHQYVGLFQNTMGMEIGTDFSHLYPINFKNEDTGTLYDPTTLYSGVYKDVLEDGYSYDSMLCWQIVRPYPASVVSIGAFLKTAG